MKMIAIKDIKMPVGCCEYHEGTNNFDYCPLYGSCRKRETIKTNYRPNNCPLVEVEVNENGKLC